MSSLLTSHDQQHIARMFAQEQRINGTYNKLIEDLSKILEKWKAGKKDIWVQNKEIERQINKRLEQFMSDFKKQVDQETLKAWELSGVKNDKLVEQFLSKMAVDTIMVRQGMFNRNMEAYEAFRTRVIGGMDLSERVWDITVQTKTNIEQFLESGISVGRSAEKIGRDLRQMLNDPDKVFRRVRDKNGKLVPSKPMKDYHPGQGKYRSSRMNALRLAATETNMAYRQADHLRWLQLDFILGFEVHRSQNHKPCAVCDAMVGKYPKEFKFVGFHPFCICYATPVQMSREDFVAYLINEKIPEDKYVRTIPETAIPLIEKYLNKGGALPYFIEDNMELLRRWV